MADHEFHSLIDPFQILVVNRRGVLRKVHCPFRVLCTEAVDGLEVNQFYYVAMVSAADNKICYHVNDQRYAHSYFRLFIT